ncbi:hypothetical protein AGMMS50276_32260 [Synergistales bacterium]|nr:hypothetical protein AGMMS50276_32260 [Synergistales bacterium]
MSSIRFIDKLPKVIREFHRLFPQIRIDVVQKNPFVLLNMLAQQELDIVFIVVTTEEISYPYTDVKMTNQQLLAKEEVVIALSKEHALSSSIKREGQNTQGLSILGAEPFALTHYYSSIRIIADRIFEQAKIQPYIKYEVQDVYVARELIKSTNCLSFLPKSDVLCDPNLTYISLYPPQYRYIVATYQTDNSLTKTEEYLINLMREEFTPKLSD